MSLGDDEIRMRVVEIVLPLALEKEQFSVAEGQMSFMRFCDFITSYVKNGILTRPTNA